jgi:hypothetical protein
MASNEFYVRPADYGSGFREIAGAIDDFKQKKDQRGYQAAAKKAASEAMQSGDFRKMREAVINFPEISETMTTLFGFTNDQTEQVAKDAYRKSLSDPENAAQYLQEGMAQVQQLGGRPTTMGADLEMFQRDPEAGLKNMRVGFAGIASDAEYGALFGNTGASVPAGTAEFNALIEAAKSDDPLIAEAANIKLGRTARAGMSAGERVAMDPALSAAVAASGAQQAGASEGARLGAQLQGQPAVEAAVTTARITAQNQAAARSPEAQQAERVKIANADDTIAQVDNLIGNDEFLDSLTGVRGKLIPIPGTPGFDAEVAFNQFKDSLTLENLTKMTGILTDRDIQLLSSAASGLERGMSRTAMDSRLQTIRGVLAGKSETARAKLEGMMGGTGQQSAGIMNMSNAQLQALNPADLSDAELQQAADRFNQLGGQ